MLAVTDVEAAFGRTPFRFILTALDEPIIVIIESAVVEVVMFTDLVITAPMPSIFVILALCPHKFVS